MVSLTTAEGREEVVFSIAATTSAPPTGLDKVSASEGAELPPSVDSTSPGGDERGVANSSSNLEKTIVYKEY